MFDFVSKLFDFAGGVVDSAWYQRATMTRRRDKGPVGPGNQICCVFVLPLNPEQHATLQRSVPRARFEAYVKGARLANQQVALFMFLWPIETLGVAWAWMMFTSQRWPYNMTVPLAMTVVSLALYRNYFAVKQVYVQAAAVGWSSAFPLYTPHPASGRPRRASEDHQ